MKLRHLIPLVVLPLLAGGCSHKTVHGNDLKAGGSTFINPLMVKWAEVYEKERGTKLTYLSMGSGTGIFQMVDKTLDFGCSDAPMDEQELINAGSVGGEVLHIPLVLGGVVPAYNLPGIEQPVRFTGPLLADIFLGNIRKWNDPRLQAVQEKVVTLPDREIALVHRSDGSGTTAIFVEYLTKVSPEWRDKVGSGTAVKWPVGRGENGNRWVTDRVKKTPGAVGYIQLDYAISNEVQFGAVQNQEGKFVQAGFFSVTAAAAASLSLIPDDLRYSLVDAPGADSYPISGTTWALVYARPLRQPKLVAEFLRWATHDGQKYCRELNFSPLPNHLVERVNRQLAKIQVD